jgi:uncharacterized protein
VSACPAARRRRGWDKLAIIVKAVFLFILGAGLAVAQSGWREQAILHLESSPAAKVKGVPVRAVEMGPGFWAERRKVVTEASIPSLWAEFEQRGIIDNFRRLAGKQVARRGPIYTDSDVYKWMEAVAFEVQAGERRNLPLLEEAIRIVSAAQEKNGYLNTRYTMERLSDRHQNMLHGHELYCLGHLIAGRASRGTAPRASAT